ncbi:protein C-mannosyl-transferase DPY19L1-like [Clavelina lepadiformis]|uniref:protein C-mannosyl-transferase DPY19L1-like n=1 Tax=Clavelina lepadiformis TaxID=159417 RepID=UPI0040437066
MVRKQPFKGSNGNGDLSKMKKSSTGNRRGKKDAPTIAPSAGGKSSYFNNWVIVAFLLAGVAGWMHGVHIWTMFENDRHFSHLSSLERDLTFRTEMGLYYSYFKTMVEAPSTLNGIGQIVRDNITEYPSTINVLKRFNLYPELIIGAIYRAFRSFTEAAKIKTQTCWKINRGELPPINSCEGIGVPHYFYVTCIYTLNSIMMSLVFLYGWYLSGNSLWGAVICVAFYFFNHGEATRVMWTPPLRESYSFPFLILELLLVTHMIKTQNPNYFKHMTAICLAAFFFMLPWQFAQFALLTQSACVLALYMLEYIGSWKLNIVIHAQLIALLANFVFQFGNEMLLTSFYASSLLSIMLIVKLESKIEGSIRNLIAKCLVKGIVWLVGTFGLKKVIATALRTADDAHIWEIFKSKFSDFNNFHTMLYTCAKEFDFLEVETVVKLSKTLLIPSMIFITFVLAIKCLRYEYLSYVESNTVDEDGQKPEVPEYDAKVAAHRCKPNADVLYNVLQMIAFSCMAILIMRLKLFMTPMMAITASLFAHRQLFAFLGPRYRQVSFLVAILAVASVAGIGNLTSQWNIIGEFENWPHEELLNFINENLPPNAVFAGAMPTMASIKLSCLRPIVNHPHYEDAGLRERTMRVYSMYSRRSLEQVRDTVEAMGVDFYILEDSWCTRKTREGCQMPQIWDIEEPENAGKTPACSYARGNPEPYFKEVFKNNVYTLLQVVKKNPKA